MKLELVASLKKAAGFSIAEFDFEGKLYEVLKKLRNEVEFLSEVLEEDGRPRPGILLFIDGTDYRIVDKNYIIKKDTLVTIIPVNHGG